MKKKNIVVSFAFNAHDSSVTVADDKHVLLVIEAERFFRQKRKLCASTHEMEMLILHALSILNLNENDVSYWCGTAFENKFLPENKRTCSWIKEFDIRIFDNIVNFYAVNHHLAHASFFYGSGFDNAIIKSCDGGGDGLKHVVYYGQGNDISLINQADIIKRFNGTFYDVVSSYIYGEDGQEGKFMGLSGYGQIDDNFLNFFEDHCETLCNKAYYDPYGNPELGWRLLNDLKLNKKNIDYSKVKSFAKSAQYFFEEKQIESLKPYENLSDNLVLVGGSALNILANTQIKKHTKFKNIYIPPCCDDTGQSLGALLFFMNNKFNINPIVNYPFLGEGKGSTVINDSCIEQVISDLKNNKVVAWHYGKGEIGPRALGHRSLLCAPFTIENRILVSEKIKKREYYRPVAPIILYEKQDDYFDFEDYSPYMLFSTECKSLCRENAPAVVHVDNSSRLQSISSDFDSSIYSILKAWYEVTTIPILINTSLNAAGKPINNTYEDTIDFVRDNSSVSIYFDGKKYLR